MTSQIFTLSCIPILTLLHYCDKVFFRHFQAVLLPSTCSLASTSLALLTWQDYWVMRSKWNRGKSLLVFPATVYLVSWQLAHSQEHIWALLWEELPWWVLSYTINLQMFKLRLWVYETKLYSYYVVLLWWKITDTLWFMTN